MIMIIVVVITVPSVGMVPGGLITASTHISMAFIITIQSLVMVMALFGITRKVFLFSQVHRDENSF